MKPRYAMRARLLDAMKACPTGKRLCQYAEDMGANRQNVEKCAGMLFELGQVVRVRVGHYFWWTASGHEQTMIAAAATEKDRQLAELEESGVLAARKDRDNARRRDRVRRHRAMKAGNKPAKREGPRRYEWPAEGEWTAPRLIRSVWELAA